MIRLFKDEEKEFGSTSSDPHGNYSLVGLTEGTCRMEVPARAGFNKLIIKNIKIRLGETLDINLTLPVIGEVVGIFLEDPLIDTSSSTIQTVFTRRQIENLPH